MELLKHVDGEILGAVFILGTIGIFISFIVVVVSIARTWNNIAVARLNQNLVQELLAKGLTVDDVERLVYGSQGWGRRFSKVFQNAKSHMADMRRRKYYRYETQPVPPMKHSV